MINLSAAFGGIINNPSWRPKFRVHWTLPLAGAIGCLFAMVMINPGATFMAAFVSGGIYYLMQRRDISAYWGDMRYGIWMLVIRTALYQLIKIKPHENTWRPNILVLSGSPTTRWYLIALADAISHGKGFLTGVTILSNENLDSERIESMQASARSYLEEKNVPAIVKVIASVDVMEGAKALILNYGFGPLLPNTILLGEADIEIYIQNDEKIFDIVRSRSANASLVFVGMRAPEEDESPESYRDYCDMMLKSTDGLPTTALVLASEKINFMGFFS